MYFFCLRGNTMPSDALTYFHLSRELDSRLSGGRIERVSMPSQNSVLFFVKPKGEKKSVALLLSAEPARSRPIKAKIRCPRTPF